MPLLALPVEIFLLILDELKEFSQLKHINALLRTNRALAELLTPALYGKCNTIEFPNGRTILHWAAQRRDCQNTIRRALVSGAETDIDINQTDIHGLAAIHCAACTADNSDFVLFLLEECGAEVNIQGKDSKQTPLALATSWGNLDTVKVLLEHGADPGLADVYGNTTLHHAVNGGEVEVVKILLECGADPTALTTTYVARLFMTPMHIAARAGKEKILEVLLENEDAREAYRHAVSEREIVISSVGRRMVGEVPLPEKPEGFPKHGSIKMWHVDWKEFLEKEEERVRDSEDKGIFKN